MKKILSILLCALTVVSLNTVNIKAAESNKLTKISNAQSKKETSSFPANIAQRRKGEKIPLAGKETNPGIATYSTDASGTCGKNVTWTLTDGVLTVSGNGAMDDYGIVVDAETGEIIESETRQVPWEQYTYDIEEVYIEDGVTSIGSIAFSDCYYLKKVVIGNSVKKIGSDAFINDDALTDLTLGTSVETIESNAFYGIGIKKLTLPSSIKELEINSLVGLWELESISISGNNKYTTIDGILYENNGQTLLLYPAHRSGEYTISSTVTKIAGNAFVYTGLTKIVVPNTVKEIESGAFSFSEDLKTLVFGKGITTIPQICCYYSQNLSSVVIPEGITTIGEASFWCCPSLKAITLPQSVIEVQDAFEDTTQVTALNPNLIRLEDGSFTCGFHVKVNAKELYKNAFKVLNLVNKERRKAGLSDLIMDQSLLETAMLRGFENIVYWSHTRPNGTDCFTANEKMTGENIAAWQQTPEEVMDSWMNSAGHRANILNSNFKSIGIGCVYVDGSYYWVQCFGTDTETPATAASYTDKNNSRSIFIKKDAEYYTAEMDIPSRSLQVGQTVPVIIRWNNNKLTGSEAIITSSNPSVCSVSGEKLTAKNPGTATITMYYKGYPEKAQTLRVSVKKITKKSSTREEKIKVSRASIRKLRNKKGRKIVISINKISKVKGYQVVYSRNKNFRKSSKITTIKPTVTISKLKKKKTYYIKVRAYKTNSAGKKVFGAYSKTKKIIINK